MRAGSMDKAEVGFATQPLLKESTARRFFVCVIASMSLLQAGYLLSFGNGLSRWDSYDEADAVRSGEAYATDGLASHHALPRILYGSRFLDVGAASDHLNPDGTVKEKYRVDFPNSLTVQNNWVYTHYPPGPNLLCGVMARYFGFDRIWAWRLVPIFMSFAALIVFFKALARAFGADRSALIVLCCGVLPMTNNYMLGLHFEGYTLTFLLLQLSVLIQMLWTSGVRFWQLLVLFLLGFIQGWLSFDHFFVVSLAVVPLWLMRRAEGVQVAARWLYTGVALPLIGFVAAHFFHLLQVAGELGGLLPAVRELTLTAVSRVGVTPGAQHFTFLRSLAQVTYLYCRDFLKLYNPHFGPFMVLAAACALPAAAFHRNQSVIVPFGKRPRLELSLSWPGPKMIWPALAAAFLVSASWSILMPAATVGNFHIWPRTFFLLYFILVLAVIRSLDFRWLRGSHHESEDSVASECTNT